MNHPSDLRFQGTKINGIFERTKCLFKTFRLNVYYEDVHLNINCYLLMIYKFNLHPFLNKTKSYELKMDDRKSKNT